MVARREGDWGVCEIDEGDQEVQNSPWLVWLSGLTMGCEQKGCQLDSQSGHMPGLWARSPVRGV